MSCFTITFDNLQWILGPEDDPEDLCSHGQVLVHLSDAVLIYDCCTSASALRMLRTLTEDHEMEDRMCGSQMLPCCGHVMFAADKELQNVDVQGCPNGIDYAVHHDGDDVIVTTESGENYHVPYEEYRREVLKFAQAVEDFYAQSAPKILPKDGYDRDGYIAFWNEWNRHMDQAKSR